MCTGIKDRIKKEFQILKCNIPLILITCLIGYLQSFPMKNLVNYFEVPVQNNHINDFFHNILPEYRNGNIHDLSQTIIWIFTISIAWGCPLFLPRFQENGKYMLKTTLAITIIFEIMYFLRFFAYITTILPDPKYACRGEIEIDRPTKISGRFFFQIFSIFVRCLIQDLFFKIYMTSCGDLMFSGHNSIALLFPLCINWFYGKLIQKKYLIIMNIMYVIMFFLQVFFSLLQRA